MCRFTEVLTLLAYDIIEPVHLRDLRSFPTRRSSDLMTSQQVLGVMRLFTTGLGVMCDHCHVSQQDRASDDKPPKLVARKIDRKSTRLNSSHLGISYAVFCLKKKTEMAMQRSRLPAHT